MLRLGGATIPPESVGQFVPFLLGGPLRDVPALPVSVGEVNTLAVALAATGAPTTISVSDPMALEACPPSGTLQIDNERFTYTSRNLNTLQFLGITRARSGTAAAAHLRGSTVYRVTSTALYVVCENPNDHLTTSITAVKLNGAVKLSTEPPTHVLTMDDQTLFPGKSVVSLRFDLTTVPPETVQITQSGWHHEFRDPVTGRWRYRWVNSSYTVSRYQYAPSLVGQVTVDAVGLKDDTIGTITGVPSSLIQYPAHVTRLLMRESYQERASAQYDGTWATTHTLQLAERSTWAFVFLPMPFAEFRERVALHGLAEIVWDPDVWRYLPRQVLTSRTPSYTLDARSQLASPTLAWTPSTDLITTLMVTHGQPPHQRNFTLTSAYEPRYGGRPGTLELPWLKAPTRKTSTWQIAQRLARYWLSQWERPRLTGTLTAGWEALALELVDLVTLDTDLLDVYGVRATAFEVRGMRHRVDERLIDLIVAETDPWALRLRSGYAIQAAVIALSLPSGYQIVSTALSVSDTVALSAAETAVVAGLLRSADTVAMTISDPTPVIPESAAKSVSDTVAITASESAVVAGLLKSADTLPLTISDPTPSVVVV